MESTEQAVESLCNLFSSYHKKSAHALKENVSALINRYGIDHIGFFTITFPDNVIDHEEAYNRFRSFNSNYFSKHPEFLDWIAVKERQKRGAWHYHILVGLRRDIRTGVNFNEFKKGVYRSAGDYLRGLWSDLRTNLPKYGLGRFELLPVRKNAQAMSLYVGKYISKHIDARLPDDKGVRLVNYSRRWPRSNSNFQWNTENTVRWRSNVKAFAEYHGCYSLDDLKEKFGPKWSYHYVDLIIYGNWQERLALKRSCRRSLSKEEYIDLIMSMPIDNCFIHHYIKNIGLLCMSGTVQPKYPQQVAPCHGPPSKLYYGEYHDSKEKIQETIH